MYSRKETALASVALAAALGVAATGCSPDAAANSNMPAPAFHVGCNAGEKYTGGGRVDPVGIGKVTFGFNIHGGDCANNGVKGNIQVVYHDLGQTLVHSLTEDGFSSFEDPVKGSCGEFTGTARVKHVQAGGDWHEHHYFAEVCDKAEPGHGADRFSFYLDGERGQHENVIEELLTGGNIQAHKN